MGRGPAPWLLQSDCSSTRCTATERSRPKRLFRRWPTVWSPHEGATPVKRLSGWDAVLLYSETPNVHMHTLKVAVIELDAGHRDFDIDTFRRVIHSRLYKLEPFRYQLVDIPLKMHHPMWRE